MKVSLVVAAGAHEGRVIPVTGPEFLIGRDQQCHLRPASQAISKVHCAVLVRDGKVYVKDYGSTNGTMVNDAVVQNAEVAIEDGASLRVGPLDFRVRIEKAALKPDGTPLPGASPEAAAALAAVKAAAATKAPTRDATPAPVAKPAAKPASKEAPALKVEAAPPASEAADDEQERIAAMLLGMDDAGNGDVPDGSTVMDIPSALAGDTQTDQPAKPGEKKDEKKPVQTREEMSNAANELLRKYMRRPR